MSRNRVPSALVYNVSTRDTDTVIVNGNVLMQHKEILVADEKAILAEARNACSALFRRAGVVVG